MKLLITGGCGFIGSNLIRWVLAEREGWSVINLDLLTYAGNPENLRDVVDVHGSGGGRSGRYRFIHGDIRDRGRVRSLMEEVDAVIHLAAESHVDRSVEDASPFIGTNIVGTQVLLEAALDADLMRFVHVSTDEVYGELEWRDPSRESTRSALERAHRGEAGAPSFFTEETPISPRSPYSASKAASDHLVQAYHHTHDLETVITRCSNNYGPYQFPEKLIPLMITRCLAGESLPLYGDGLHVRDWIHVTDHCRGLVAALEGGESGQVYNFGGDAERTNRQVVRSIVAATGADPDLVTSVPDRPGHDRRYAIDSSKARNELGWMPRKRFQDGLSETIDWYRQNEAWWRRVESGEYRESQAKAAGEDEARP